MKKKIQRKTDNKYLVSLEADTWTDDLTQAAEFKVGPFIKTKIDLMKKYKYNEIVEVEA